MVVEVTLVSLLDGHDDHAIALISGDDTTTYGELRALVAETRGGLRAGGLEPGDRVGVIATTTRSTLISILAAVTAGMVAVPLNPSSPPAELKRELDAVDAAIVLTASGIADDLHERLATPAGSAVPGIDPLPEGDHTAGPYPAEPDDLAVMLFTSGTAGAPKAAMLSHNNLTSNQLAMIAEPDSGYTPGAVFLASLPLSHIFGLNIAFMTTLRAGATMVLLERFDPAKSIELVARHGVTLFAGVPPMWRAILDLDGVDDDAFSGVHRLSSGAAALSRVLFDEFRDRFGVEIGEGYGLTETSPAVTTHIGIPIRPGSVGRALPGVEVAVVDYDGLPALTDDSGAIRVRGPGVFLGYWNDEEATKAVLDDDGWLETGDVGLLSDDGYLSLVDRAKDLIIVSGFNVYPYEVEAVVKRHPAVSEAIVVGREDPRRGERVVAYVTAGDPDAPPDFDDVVRFCRGELARYKCPSELRVVESLPVTAAGKRVRRDLV